MTVIFKNPNSFLTGTNPFISMSPVETLNGGLGGEITFENHHEGYIGIPHGGVAMGLCLDVWKNTDRWQYPVKISFRFAGSGISIGEKAIIEIEPEIEADPHTTVIKITKLGDRKPYLRAVFSKAGEDFPQSAQPMPSENYRGLPYYKNCLVCGHAREVVGLERLFRFHEVDGQKMVTVVWGNKDEDFDRAKLFLFDRNELHPLVLIAIFDENTAWGGFMENKLGGLSVKLDFFLKRPIRPDEQLLYIGRPAGIRGAPSAPRFFHARGEILSMTDPKNPEIVAHGWGEWVVLGQYTEQIKLNLIPKSEVEWIFS